ncbi:MAG: hypothetical protein LC790_14220 [Actinobacteria bacterium]|nr:hypothetical protein [Actinomycetota bacterium]
MACRQCAVIRCALAVEARLLASIRCAPAVKRRLLAVPRSLRACTRGAGTVPSRGPTVARGAKLECGIGGVRSAVKRIGVPVTPLGRRVALLRSQITLTCYGIAFLCSCGGIAVRLAAR